VTSTVGKGMKKGACYSAGWPSRGRRKLDEKTKFLFFFPNFVFHV
jgi:hypothetical protein